MGFGFDITEIFLGSYRGIITVFAILATCLVLLHYLRMWVWSKRFSRFLQELKDTPEYDMNRRHYHIDEWVGNQNSRLMPAMIRNSWNKYYEDVKNTGDSMVVDPYEYFKEDDFVNKYGRRKLVESLPSVFVSLGILGTFFGLIQGMNDIEPSGSSENMMQGVNSLLSGMSFAFYSSIAGIILSIVFQVLDRMYLYGLLTNSIGVVRESLDNTIPIKTEGSLLNDLAQSQQEQMNDLKTFFADTLIPQLTSGISESISQSMNDSLQPHLEKSNQIMEQVVEGTMEKQDDKLNEMVNHFVESLNEVTGDHMKHLGEALDKTIEWQEKVHKEMGDLVEKLKETAEQQSEMSQHTTALSGQMNEHTQTLSDYHEKMNNLIGEINTVTGQNTDLLAEMREVSQTVSEHQQKMEDQIESKLSQMDSVMERITEQGSMLTNIQNETHTTIESLSDAAGTIQQQADSNAALNQSLVEQHEKTNEWNEKTQHLIEDLVQNTELNQTMQASMNELYEQISAEREKVEGMKDEQLELIQNSFEELKQYWDESKYQLTTNKEELENLNQILDQNMEQFADSMQRGVQKTFGEFDAQLKQAVEYLERGVGSISQVVESMDEDIGKIRGSVNRFNESLEQIASTKQ